MDIRNLGTWTGRDEDHRAIGAETDAVNDHGRGDGEVDPAGEGGGGGPDGGGEALVEGGPGWGLEDGGEAVGPGGVFD